MNLLQAILLSVIEGVTEFLPVSSTGHLILAGSLLKIPHSDFLSSFEIFIQLGAILGIIIIYGKPVFVQTYKLYRLSAAFIPTAIVGFLLYKVVKQLLLGNPWIVVSSLIIGGIILILFERMFDSKKHDSLTIDSLPISKAICIGLFQAISIIPGVSRSAATIIGSQIMGLSKKDAVEFSFLLAVPTMAAATMLDLLKSHAYSFSTEQWGYLSLGFILSCLTAIIVVKLFIRIIQQKNIFVWFGIYRIVMALLYTGIVIH